MKNKKIKNLVKRIFKIKKRKKSNWREIKVEAVQGNYKLPLAI